MASKTEAIMPGEPLKDLAARVAAACADPRYNRRKRLWHAQNGLLQKGEKVPCHVHLFLSGEIEPQWKELIQPDEIVCTDPFERSLEIQLRKRLYKHERIADDDVILPYVLVPVEMRSQGPLWGVPTEKHKSDDPDGAWKGIAPFDEEIDLSRLRAPRFDVDLGRTAANVERARELLGERIEVIPWRYIPLDTFDMLVRLRGAEKLMMDVIDQPERVHAMTRFVVEATVAWHRQREAAGFCDPRPTWLRCRSHYEELERPEGGAWKLDQEWAFVSAQTSMGLSPAMFEEFCHAYHQQHAAEHGPHRVYYHGCECLDQRMDIIRSLVNLRRFHVSPWTSLQQAARTFGKTCVLECHVHPAETLMNPKPQYMRDSIRRILDAAGDCIIDINLSDIHTVNGHPESLRQWAEIAQELTA
jgi:hypothetical protein